MSLLFSTGWGALYLIVLLILMLPALAFPAKRWLALWMLFLWVLDRTAVALLPPDLALFFLAFAYTFVAVAARTTHRGIAAMIMSGCLVGTSIAFIGGGYGGIDWDTAGSIQEALGLIAMLSIIWRRPDGARLNQHADGRASGVRRDLVGGAAARHQARK
jgi:hypothetical protein